MEQEIKIDSLKVVICKKEIELTIEDANRLKNSLEDIFSKDVICEHHDHWWYRSYRVVYCRSISKDGIDVSTLPNNTRLCVSLD